MNSRDLISQADEIARGMGLSQAEWGRRAGLDVGGVAVGRMFNKGNCKLSTLVQLLRPLGYELNIRKVDE